MSVTKLVNIARLMTTYNLEIEQLPEDLKCAQCKLVLKDACQLPCCCRFCRVCIEDMITRGDKFCPGDSEDCGESPLSRFVTDYSSNKRILILTVKCPHYGCVHECQLVNIEQHLRECQRKSEECPFYKFGCTKDKLAAEEMGGHLQHDNHRHSEILIEMISNINREIDTLKERIKTSTREIETLKERIETSSREIETQKQKDETSSREIETLKERIETCNIEIEAQKQRDEASSREIETLKESIETCNREIEAQKQRDEASSREIETLKERLKTSSREIETQKQRDEASSKQIETLKHDIVQNNEQIGSIMDQLIHAQNENKSIKNDMKSIKILQEEKEDIAGQVRILTKKIEQEIADRHENDELYVARVIEHVDTEIAGVTRLIGSNKDELAIEMQSVIGDIGTTNQSVQSIKDDICAVKLQVQSVEALVGLGQIDASFVQLIDVALDKTNWGWRYKESEYFTGELHPYKYRLRSGNWGIGTDKPILYINLRIYAGPNDGQLPWPFEARVVITVTDRDRLEACRSISLQCQIERPSDDHCRESNLFEFLHSELRGAGLNLSRGVRVSCVIVPGAA